MKKFMIAGGFIGFLTGLILGAAQQCPWPSVIWRASAAALAAGILMRWWGRIWLSSLEELYRQRLAAEAKANEAPAITSPSKT